jgi:hypothetical protein
MSYIHLQGAEEVGAAGRTISHAADRMSSAADRMEECTRRLEILFGQGYGSNLDRLIEAIENMNAGGRK